MSFRTRMARALARGGFADSLSFTLEQFDITLDELTLGADANAGSLTIYPATTSTGTLVMSCTANSDDYAITLTNAAHGQATTITLPDVGLATSYLVQSTLALAAAEVNVLDAVTKGSVSANKALVVDGSNALDALTITALTSNGVVGGDASLGITGKSQATTVAGGIVAIAGAASIAGATGAGGACTVAGGASGATNAAGGAVTIAGGLGKGTGAGGAGGITGGANANGSGNGGDVNLSGGACSSTSTGDGGAATLAGGASAGGATGDGGAVTIDGGDSTTTSGNGGDIAVTAGLSTGANQGGLVAVTAGAGGAAGAGGTVIVAGGAPASGDAAGGLVSYTGGAGSGSGNGGAATFAGGQNAATGTGDGGAATMAGGAAGGGATGDGGAVTIDGGDATSTTGNGGDIAMTAGLSTGAVQGGLVTITAGAGGASGAGGIVAVVGGAPASGNAAGGKLDLDGGAGVGSGDGGAVEVTGGIAPGTGDGGQLTLTGGATTGGATGTGGNAVIAGGASGNATDGAGGLVSLTGGAGKGSGDGGLASLVGGVTGASGTGGAIAVTGGAGASGGTAGSVAIDAGAVNSGTAGTIGIGGANVTAIGIGNAAATTTITGQLAITDGDTIIFEGATHNAIIDAADQATADQTYTFGDAGADKYVAYTTQAAGTTKETINFMVGGTFVIAGDAKTGGLAGLDQALDLTATEAAAAYCKSYNHDNTKYANVAVTGAQGEWTANYQLFPDTEVEHDACFFGAATQFCSLWFDLSATVATYNAGAASQIWEYSKGSSVWGTLTLSSDSTDVGGAATGQQPFGSDGCTTFVPPADWATDTVDGQEAYWIRCRCTAAVDITQIPLLDSLEHHVCTPADGCIIPYACNVYGIRVTDGIVGAVHTTNDIKFVFFNFTKGTYSLELTFPQDKRVDYWTTTALKAASAGVDCDAGDVVGFLCTQADGALELTNAGIELYVTATQ